MEPARPFFYAPSDDACGQTLMIRTALAPSVMTPELATEVRGLDGSVAPDQLMTMREQIGRMNQSTMMAVRLLTVFGALALILAAIGLYRVMSFDVTQNSRELALRLALGASPSTLLRPVLDRAKKVRPSWRARSKPMSGATIFDVLRRPAWRAPRYHATTSHTF